MNHRVFRKMNDRRCELIDLSFRRALTSIEASGLAQLTRVVEEKIDRPRRKTLAEPSS